VENAPIRITRNTYCVGGPASSDISDCYIYLVDLGGPLVLIDAGAGRSVDRILRNIGHIGLKPENVVLLVLTHEHIDHVGGAATIRARLGCQVAAHQAAVPAISTPTLSQRLLKCMGCRCNPAPSTCN